MPPKKKGKRGGKKKSPRKRPPTQGEGETPESEMESFYMGQVKELDARLNKYKEKHKKLLGRNEEYQERIMKLETDKKTFIKDRKKLLEDKVDEISDLNDRLVGLGQAREMDKIRYEGELVELRNEYQEMKDTMSAANMELNIQYQALEDFKEKKDELMAKYADMEKTLKRMETDHVDNLQALEEKAVHDRDIMKKEITSRVTLAASESRKVSNKQMPETTKRTLRDNVSIKAQLVKMEDKKKDYEQDNEVRLEKIKETEQEIIKMEQHEKELAKTNYGNLKLVSMLSERNRLNEEMIEMYKKREEDTVRLEDENEEMNQELEEKKEQTEELKKVQQNLKVKLINTKEELQEEKQAVFKLQKIFDKTSDTLKEALKIKKAPQDSESDAGDEGGKKEDIPEEDTLELLIQLLEEAGATVTRVPRRKTASKMPGSVGGIRRGKLPMATIAPPNGTIPHYKLGNLGIVPGPEQFLPTAVQKTKLMATEERLGQLRRVLTKSVSVQTVSAAKAMFYADRLKGKPAPSRQGSALHEIRLLESRTVTSAVSLPSQPTAPP